MIELSSARILIIEDEEKNRDFISRVLLDDVKVSSDNIEEAENLKKAKEIIEEFEPNIILLDLKIPSADGFEPSMVNAYEVIQKAQLFNYKQNNQDDKIKIIVISGSINDLGVQKLISLNKDVVFDFFDKNEISISLDKFKKDLKKKIVKALKFEGVIHAIDYSFVRRSILKNIESINVDLWNKIEKDLLLEFEKLNDKKVNEYSVSKSIIGTCGEIVEDLIHLFKEDLFDENKAYSQEERSVLNKLTKLSGRKYSRFNEASKEKEYELLTEKKISRKSAEYALMAYRLRSQALHSTNGDDANNKWFANSKFTKEDASISINLIVPIIQDFIAYKKKK